MIIFLFGFYFRPPDFYGSDRVSFGRAQGRVGGCSGVDPAPDQGRMPLLLRHPQGRRRHRRQGQGRVEDAHPGKDCPLRNARLHPGWLFETRTEQVLLKL